MNYIARKQFDKICFQGKINIPYGTTLTCVNDILFYDKKAVCYITSQDAFDYFITDFDNQGMKRGQLVDWILLHTNKQYNTEKLYDKIWNMIWNTSKYAVFKRPEFDDRWLWSFNFYNASIEDLEQLVNDIKNIEQGDC